MIDESEFNALAEEYLEELFLTLEDKDIDCLLDIDFQNGVLIVEIEDSRQQFVINKHAVNQEIWLSSPISGGHHFAFDNRSDLSSMLITELSNITGYNF